MKKKSILFILIFATSYSSLQANDPISDEPIETTETDINTESGIAATESAEESKNSHKNWRRAGLITAGVAVAALAIYSVTQNQGQRVCK